MSSIGSYANRPAIPAACLAALALAACAAPGAAQQRAPAAPQAQVSQVQNGLSYADLIELAEKAEIVVIAAITDQIRIEPERAPGLAPGKARLYLEAATEALLVGPGGVGESLAFLADREFDAEGEVPDLEEQRYLLFARAVPGRPGELQLAGPSAMLPASPALVDRTRMVLRQLAAPADLPQITGIREAISIEGNLAGESETQIFLETASGDPVSLTVIRRPNMDPRWGVSWTEIVDQAAVPPERETLEWYRLACFLPGEVPDDAFLQEDAAARARAREDYAFILAALGPCERSGA